MIFKSISSKFKKVCIYRVVVPSCKPDDEIGGMVQKSWFGLFLNFENLHNPEHIKANKMVKLWKELKKTKVEYDDAVKNRRSKVLNAGVSKEGPQTKGIPYEDGGYTFELRKVTVPEPNKDVLKEVMAALARFGRANFSNLTGTDIDKKDIIKQLREKGKCETVASSISTDHISISGEPEVVHGIEHDKIMPKKPQNNNSGKKDKQQHPQGNRGGYRESD